MPVPSYAGFQIFGNSWKTTGNMNERDAQRQSYAGLSGVEHLDLGGRGRTSTVRAILSAGDVADLLVAKFTLESYHDGVPRVYVDSTGTAWQNVLLGAPKFEGIQVNAGLGFWIRFEVELRHLSSL